jgi:hypothetical protein
MPRIPSQTSIASGPCQHSFETMLPHSLVLNSTIMFKEMDHLIDFITHIEMRWQDVRIWIICCRNILFFSGFSGSSHAGDHLCLCFLDTFHHIDWINRMLYILECHSWPCHPNLYVRHIRKSAKMKRGFWSQSLPWGQWVVQVCLNSSHKGTLHSKAWACRLWGIHQSSLGRLWAFRMKPVKQWRNTLILRCPLANSAFDWLI